MLFLLFPPTHTFSLPRNSIKEGCREPAATQKGLLINGEFLGGSISPLPPPCPFFSLVIGLVPLPLQGCVVSVHWI